MSFIRRITLGLVALLLGGVLASLLLNIVTKLTPHIVTNSNLISKDIIYIALTLITTIILFKLFSRSSSNYLNEAGLPRVVALVIGAIGGAALLGFMFTIIGVYVNRDDCSYSIGCLEFLFYGLIIFVILIIPVYILLSKFNPPR